MNRIDIDIIGNRILYNGLILTVRERQETARYIRLRLKVKGCDKLSNDELDNILKDVTDMLGNKYRYFNTRYVTTCSIDGPYTITEDVKEFDITFYISDK